MILRCDGERSDRLGDCDGRDITGDMLKEFLPNWESLSWRTSETFGPRALCSQDGEFKVRLLIAEASSLSDSQIISEFRKFMAAIRGV